MTKVTYLLGAGASYDAVPIVGEMEFRSKLFLESIQNRTKYTKDALYKTMNVKYQIPINDISDSRTGNIEKLLKASSELKNKYLEQRKKFLADFKWMTEELSNHSSVDTFAKKLYLKENEGDDEASANLKKLKYILSAYLTIEQVINGEDQRYDKFFATILQESIRIFPEQIRIISWNYDFQFELAYSDYSGEESLSKNLINLKVITKNSKGDKKEHGFSIYKLNGTSGFVRKDSEGESEHVEGPIIDKFRGKKIKDILVSIYLNHAKISNGNWKMKENERLSMSFAWEDKDQSSSLGLKLRERMADTDELVIIGYSFPTFNNKSDKLLLGGLNYTKLNKIHIQDKDPDAVASTLTSMHSEFKNKINTEPSKKLEEFYIPRSLIF